MAERKPIISFRNFSFQYRAQKRPTLTDINLEIYPGERVLIAGPSGSGKSTLAGCINGLNPFSNPGACTGTLTVDGVDAPHSSLFELSAHVGTVLQDPDGQFIGLTVGEDIAFALENSCTPQNEMHAITRHAAELVGIENHLGYAPHELSGGQKQRVSLAGVMVDQVKILLFDEPLANLDPATGKQAIELIDEIQKKTDTTVLIIEHRLEDVLWRNVDRIVLVNDGTILADLRPDELLSGSLLAENGIEAVGKDTLGARVGIVNKAGTDLILQFKKHLPELAAKMPFADAYRQSILDGEELKQTMVDVDLADLEGDYAQCRGGITTAQNLPNNDKLSVKTGGGRRNVYHRQVRMSVDREKERKMLERLLDPALHRYFDNEADHLFVIGHENGHSLGPDSSYQNALGAYKHIIEEHKADTVSLAFMPEYVNAGVIDEETLKKIYVSYIAGRMFLAARPHMMLPHRMGELIQFNYLREHGIIKETADGRITIDLDNVGGVLNRLLEETVRVQLSKSKENAAAFVEKYAVWSPLSEKIAAVRQELGVKPYKRIVRCF